MKDRSGPELKSFESACALSPPDNPQRAIMRLHEGQTEIELKCNIAMLKKFSDIKMQYLQSLADNLESRLTSETPEGSVLHALSELTSPKSIHAMSLEEDQTQMKGFLQTVCSWYAGKSTEQTVDDGNTTSTVVTAHRAIVTEAELMSELPKLTTLVSECYKQLEPAAFIQRILAQHAEDLPHYTTMCKLLLCIPITSVECERAFSLQNRLKTKLRNRLGEERVDLLMVLNMGPPIDRFDHVAVVRHWRAEKKRKLSMLYRPSKKCKTE